VFLCISPWNFPLAIFTGQVSAALAAGNAVLAKPAELNAARRRTRRAAAGTKPACRPKRCTFCPVPDASSARGRRPTRASRVLRSPARPRRRSGSTSHFAARNSPIGVLIAETGGQNAMLVDSSALPEQVVLDAVQSGFNSAGQRCSRLRVLISRKTSRRA
jgi:RHH-type proline utilization regulon transcriptional repressor/proline dehydrogenase/delta 1-pyrroline-5-carboxylate dehydrogenase